MNAEPDRGSMYAMAAPLVCAVHCLSAPVLVLVAPALAPTARLEWALFLVSLAVIAGVALRMGRGCVVAAGAWIAMAVGAGVWAGSLAGWFEPVPEAMSTLVGTGALAVGVFWNARRCRQAGCGCTACEDAAVGAAEAGASRGRRGEREAVSRALSRAGAPVQHPAPAGRSCRGRVMRFAAETEPGVSPQT